ncbi:MAG: PP2C family protein-serine/threonine phosphatase [Ignavibacteriae bacterium]|nr:PP2C family protein-serine/threonine phosphatase [Ignavibacteriota bacterium]
MASDLITEKLSFQVKSFQESFEILTNSITLNGMAKQFDKILRGNFFTTKVNIFHRDKNTPKWINLINKNVFQHQSEVENFDETALKIVSNSDSSELFTITKLIDSKLIAIVLGKKFDETSYSEIDKITFQIFIQIFDSAYQVLLSRGKEKKLIFSLNNRVSQLYSLIDTGIEISKIRFGNDLLELALSRAIALTNSSYGRIKVTNKKGNIDEIHFPPNIIYGKPKVKFRLIKKFVDVGIEYEFTLCEKESREGIIQFEDTDELLLGAIARQVQAAIENDRANKEALENETMKRELAVAASIQKRILPEKLPTIDGYDISGINIPSKEVSGDYYNVFKLEDGRYAVIVADVTGKGMPAALLVSTLDASLRSYLDFHIPLSEMAVKMNTIIYKSSTADKFITFLIAVLNPENGDIDIINAGHNPALILRKNNKIEKIDAGGVAFGMFDMGLPFASEKLNLKKGERLFIFSDGILEAMDKKEVEYTDERLEKYFVEVKPKSASEFISSIVADVRSHTKGEIQSDDITALYLIRQ